MMDNPTVQTFSHVGNKNGTGLINFEDAHGSTIASIEMARHHDGLWYTTNPVLMPPQDDTTSKTTIDLERPVITKTATTTSVESGDNTVPMVKLSKSLKQLELWHQRMGHPAPRALLQTQRVVEGIPKLPNDHALFKCPFCDKAKLRKANRHKESLREVFIPGTSFHMDLGFIRGPSNLEDVVKNGATPNKTIIKSRDGYEAYSLLTQPKDTFGSSS
jgi:hypothetical protein